MRAFVLAFLLLLTAPIAARAETAAVPVVGTADEAAGGYRVVAIAAGAVAGVIVANAVTGGMATPALVLGAADAATLMPGSGIYLSAATAVMGAVTSVCSHAIFRTARFPPAASSEMVNCSTGADRCFTAMLTRPKSSDSL